MGHVRTVMFNSLTWGPAKTTLSLSVRCCGLDVGPGKTTLSLSVGGQWTAIYDQLSDRKIL